MITDTAAVNFAAVMEAREDLYFYSRYMFRHRKGFKWKHNWHHKVICDALMRVFRGECKRLIINIPPRYSKTELAVINFMSWSLGHNPDAEFIHTSYSGTLAVNNSFMTKLMVQDEHYQQIFPNVVLRQDSKSKNDWRTTEGGVIYAAGAGATITGFGAGKMRPGFGGAIIIDDPHKADEATSDTIRGNVLDWFGNTLESRTNHPDTPIILIMQRLHEEDLSGFLLAGGNGEDWEVLNIPAIQEDDTALWDFKHSREDLERMQKANPYVFAGQYMQRPAPLGGGIFKESWWRYYMGLPVFKRIIQSWDTAFKKQEHNDFSVCTTWGETDTGYYLINRHKAKQEYPELKRTAINLAEMYKPHVILVEDKASGQTLIQELRRETRMPIVAIQVDSDKVSRAHAVTPLIESGRVYLPEKADWLLDYISNMGTFPNAAHDDDVDSTTQALNYMARGGGSTGLLDYYAEEARKMKEART
jgi:predicted phage terminase large subunit-like protein